MPRAFDECKWPWKKKGAAHGFRVQLKSVVVSASAYVQWHRVRALHAILYHIIIYTLYKQQNTFKIYISKSLSFVTRAPVNETDSKPNSVWTAAVRDRLARPAVRAEGEDTNELKTTPKTNGDSDRCGT